MIDYQINPTKRFIFKIVAIFLIVAFVWYDISWAGDLYNYSLGHTGQTAPLASAGLVNHDKAASQTKEVTNYDELSYDRKQSIARKLLPTGAEVEQSQNFAPGYIQSQESKHEEIIRQKQDSEDMLWSLDDRLKRKLKKEDEQLDLKKKKGGPDSGKRGKQGMENAEYELTDPDSLNSPHNYEDFENPTDLTRINKFDITMTNIEKWMEGATKRTDEKTGIDYWLGFDDKGNPDESKRIMTVFYTGSGSDKKIDHILTGYRLTAGGTYEAKYDIEYSYSGSDITETNKYDISDGGRRLVEKNLYEGTGDDNRLKSAVYYGQDGTVTGRRDFQYSAEGALKETLLYSTNSQIKGEGELTEKTAFSGDKGKEIANYTQNYYTDKTTGQRYTTQTTVYYYQDGKRADQTTGQEYRYSRSKQISYMGDPDANGDGA
ncbi:MAG: hypothetical protein WC404_06630, partial [Candidatus Omnitrophota bacterium]